ncbi:MAG: S-ribosylhomocysteine lyase [Clostridia bacterium]|nr:S-ribosylhomocysteine lyase [Clostridia bacterium]MDY4083324.1 S-ribosylhomocysteine lyase [Eubacteriales bacterium]
MDNIKSFELDHNAMTPGFYCLGQANGVFTYDLRFKKPNGGDYISYKALHSIEHLFAVVIRNSDIKDKVVYFGPMGCRTGFYLLLYGIEERQAKAATIDAVKKCLTLDYVPGTKPIECGNYLEHDLVEAQKELKAYLNTLTGENNEK